MLEPYCFGCFSIIPLLFFMESLVVCNCVKPLLLLIYIFGGGGGVGFNYCYKLLLFFFFWSNPNVNTMFCYGFHECCKVYFTKLIFRST